LPHSFSNCGSLLLSFIFIDVIWSLYNSNNSSISVICFNHLYCFHHYVPIMLSKAFSRSTKASYTFFVYFKNFSTMVCKNKMALMYLYSFESRIGSSARFSSIFFTFHPKIIFVKILDVCVRMLRVRYSSHFINLLFFANITILLFLKSRIFPVAYMLLIRQYKVCFVYSSSACSNSAGMLSTPYAFFDFRSFNTFPEFWLCYWWTQFIWGNSSFLSNSSSSFLIII